MNKKVILKIALSITIILLILCILSIFIVVESYMQAPWSNAYCQWIEFIIKADCVAIILSIIGIKYYSRK